MALHQITERIYTRLLAESSEATLILLHPDSKYRSMLVAYLVNADSLNILYYALGPDDIDLLSFIYSLTHDLARQHPTFGRNLNLLSDDDIGETVHPFVRVNRLVDAFVSDLSELSPPDLFLILDEYDCSDTSDDIQRFVERVALSLPPGCKIILNGRTLPRLPWMSLIAANKAIILEDEHILISDFHGKRTPGAENILQVRALGPGFVLLNDQPIDSWEGHLPRLLFFFALDRPAITRSEICAAFWPELELEQAVNVFHVTKRRLHKALGLDVLDHSDDHYHLNLNIELDYDVARFVTQLSVGRRTTGEEQIRAWQEAVSIYSSPFLRGHQDDWIVDRRRSYVAGLVEAHSAMATLRRQEARYNHALSHILRALDADWMRKTLHVTLMELYVELGRRSEAVAHYYRLTSEADRLGLSLDPDIHATFASITAG